MTDWKPDEKFLDWLLKKHETETGDVDTPIIGIPNGTKKGGQGYSFREIIAEMKKGNEPFIRQYKSFYRMFGQEYESSKSQHP